MFCRSTVVVFCESCYGDKPAVFVSTVPWRNQNSLRQPALRRPQRFAWIPQRPSNPLRCAHPGLPLYQRQTGTTCPPSSTCTDTPAWRARRVWMACSAASCNAAFI